MYEDEKEKAEDEESGRFVELGVTIMTIKTFPDDIPTPYTQTGAYTQIGGPTGFMFAIHLFHQR